jgi:TfoX/Sxy family transcriptional regulator of competence genes
VPESADQKMIEARFAGLARALADRPEVELAAQRRGFGRGTLQVRGRIFAMISRGRLVLKLPRERVAELIATGDGQPFDAGKGRPLAEWLTLGDSDDTRWRDLAREAADFVSRAGQE